MMFPLFHWQALGSIHLNHSEPPISVTHLLTPGSHVIAHHEPRNRHSLEYYYVIYIYTALLQSSHFVSNSDSAHCIACFSVPELTQQERHYRVLPCHIANMFHLV